MSARDIEAALYARCVAVARDATLSAQDQREANVFRMVSMVFVHEYPAEAKRLMQASEEYFALNPDEKVDGSEVIRRGWVVTLPRLRDRLGREFRGL